MVIALMDLPRPNLDVKHVNAQVSVLYWVRFRKITASEFQAMQKKRHWRISCYKMNALYDTPRLHNVITGGGGWDLQFHSLL